MCSTVCVCVLRLLAFFCLLYKIKNHEHVYIVTALLHRFASGRCSPVSGVGAGICIVKLDSDLVNCSSSGS